MPGLQKLKRWAGRCGRYLTSGALVLMYHRVHEASSDPWSLNVSELHFDQHMQVLSDRFSVISVANMNRAIREGHVPRRAVAVTFDDGYADNVLKAQPLLLQHEVPATVFVTAGQSNRGREFWWDELERLVIQTTTLPSTLEMRLGDRVYEWQIPDAQGNPVIHQSNSRGDSPSGYAALLRSSQSLESRLDLYYQIWGVLQSQLQPVQDEMLDYLAGWCGEEIAPREANRVMTCEELRMLSNSPLIDIGAHTSTHPKLTVHSVAFQKKELFESKTWLEQVCDKAITGLAYPHGSQNSDTRTVAREAGYEFACTTEDALVWRLTDPFQIPRMTVLDWDGEEFERQLMNRFTNSW